MTGVETPILASWKWPEFEDPAAMLDEEYYDRFLSIVGSLNWLAVKTRPDIRYAVTKLQHRSSKPTNDDYEAMIHLCRYIKRYDSIGIELGKVKDLRLMAHADASHADWHDRKSTEGSIWWLAGAPIMWSTKKQTLVASSTTAAEWCALDQPAKDAMWLSKIATQLGLPAASEAVTIHTDNINTQLLLAKKGCKNSTRWLEIRYFFVKNAVARGKIDVKRVNTKSNPADGFTKALDVLAFKHFIKMLGMNG
jgi:hypothetical protein